jgi:hypothetical protein
MNSRWDILVAFAKHHLDAQFNSKGDGLHCEHNGHTLSLQWGHGNYCTDRWKGSWDQKQPYVDNFEMAVIGPDGKFLQLQDYDQVIGWVPWSNLDMILFAFTAGAYDHLERIAHESDFERVKEAEATHE